MDSPSPITSIAFETGPGGLEGAYRPPRSHDPLFLHTATIRDGVAGMSKIFKVDAVILDIKNLLTRVKRTPAVVNLLLVTMAKIVKTPLSIASHVGLGELALSWLQYCVANITFATPALFCNEGILFQRQQHLSVPQIKTPTTSIDWVQYVADFQSCQQ